MDISHKLYAYTGYCRIVDPQEDYVEVQKHTDDQPFRVLTATDDDMVEVMVDEEILIPQGPDYDPSYTLDAEWERLVTLGGFTIHHKYTLYNPQREPCWTGYAEMHKDVPDGAFEYIHKHAAYSVQEALENQGWFIIEDCHRPILDGGAPCKTR